MLTEEVKNRLVSKLKQTLDPAFIILFGSHSKGTAHEQSDIDLAYFSDREMSSYQRFILASELAELAGCEVDAVDIKQIDQVFALQVFEHGIPIDIRDENEFIRQRMRAYSMYAALNEQRKPVLDAIEERGSVYGNE